MDMFWKRIRGLATAAILLAGGAAHAEAPPTTWIVWAGKLLAVPGRDVTATQTLVIRRGHLDRIAAGRLGAQDIGADPANTRILDLSCCVVLPGLFDLHVHLTTEPDPTGFTDDVSRTSSDLALRAAVNARKTVEAGFTTVLDMGTGRRSHELAIYAVRDAIAAGKIPGPRLLAVGSPLSSPGNSRTGRYTPEVERVIPPQAVCTGADECARAVREQVERGADVINFYNTGSLLNPLSPAQTFTADEMRSIVSTAHSLNRRVVADGAGKPDSAAGVDAAIASGADWIDTVIYPGKKTWTLAAGANRMYAPHLYAVVAAVGDDETHLTEGSMGWLPIPVLETLLKLKRERPAAIEAHKAGVRMVFASDAGVFAHGLNAHEFAQYVAAGLSPTEAIQTATINAATTLGLIADSGTLEVGKRADLIAVQGNPLMDVRALESVELVMVEGRLVKLRDLGSPP